MTAAEFTPDALTEFTPFNPDSVVPPKSQLRTPSILAEFRRSARYRNLVKKLSKGLSFEGDHMGRADSMVDFLLEGGSVGAMFLALNEDEDDPQDSEIPAPDKGSPREFAYTIMELLVRKGFDNHIVEVKLKGDTVVLYLNERVGRQHREVQNYLADFGSVELAGKPEDDPELGAYVFVIRRHRQESVTEGRACRKKPRLLGLAAPQGDVFDRKGRRVLHDRKKAEGLVPKDYSGSEIEQDIRINATVWFLDQHREVQPGVVLDFTRDGIYLIRMDDGRIANLRAWELYTTRPKAGVETDPRHSMSFVPEAVQEPFEEAGSNPRPVKGDIIIDTASRRPFRVEDTVSGQAVRIRGLLPKDAPRVVQTQTIERGLSSGRMVRVNEDVEARPDLGTCPSCQMAMARLEGAKDADVDSFRCSGCGFTAEFARHRNSATPARPNSGRYGKENRDE